MPQRYSNLLSLFWCRRVLLGITRFHLRRPGHNRESFFSGQLGNMDVQGRLLDYEILTETIIRWFIWRPFYKMRCILCMVIINYYFAWFWFLLPDQTGKRMIRCSFLIDAFGMEPITGGIQVILRNVRNIFIITRKAQDGFNLLLKYQTFDFGLFENAT